MMNVTNWMIAACAGTIALACAAIQPAKAADMPPHYPLQYGGPPVVQERYVQERYYQPAPPVAYDDEEEYVPPALVPVPGPYYGPPRRVYVNPGYAYGPGPYVARGYGYHRGWGHRHHHHDHHHVHRRW